MLLNIYLYLCIFNLYLFIMNEIWKDIVGYEGLYQVSNYGRVKGLERYVNHNYGGLRRVTEKIISPYTDKRKYKGVTVRLCKSNKCKAHIVARLVAIHFIPNPYNYPQVLHSNDDPTNNSVENFVLGHISYEHSRYDQKRQSQV